MDKNKNIYATWRTDSLYLSAFLLARGLTLSTIEKLSNKKSLFVFVDSPNRQLWLDQYNFSTEDSSTCLIDPRKLVSAIKSLKEKLYQNDF
ncbi:hypothetical protein A2892_02930 [Candidatus Woesebacteria bacterium RIFCSPLOWO2_01_FULL_39_10b]|uniref:DUF5659 domain-containing protein n=1 Tax=Candidatus Woesebacteria bacterium RIFCSPLOWO2_01_FULL_39_10b TaxID=1802517 RepID=A0A1F8B7J8_9BACT|nr:MAG: hypothetical protein A2892_02930 [Candidatus Woesebacteria bacterium RIFCSPLOWO2_01_FULL_39_10b]